MIKKIARRLKIKASIRTTMGFGFPAAIGAQIGCPDRVVAAIVGDGGFQMTMEELAVIAVNKLPVKIFIMNNHFLGMVRQWQNIFYGNRLSCVEMVGNPNFVQLAKSYGIKGYSIRRSADVRRIMKAALAYKGPCVVNEQHIFYLFQISLKHCK